MLRKNPQLWHIRSNSTSIASVYTSEYLLRMCGETRFTFQFLHELLRLCSRVCFCVLGSGGICTWNRVGVLCTRPGRVIDCRSNGESSHRTVAARVSEFQHDRHRNGVEFDSEQSDSLALGTIMKPYIKCALCARISLHIIVPFKRGI